MLLHGFFEELERTLWRLLKATNLELTLIDEGKLGGVAAQPSHFLPDHLKLLSYQSFTIWYLLHNLYLLNHHVRSRMCRLSLLNLICID